MLKFLYVEKFVRVEFKWLLFFCIFLFHSPVGESREKGGISPLKKKEMEFFTEFLDMVAKKLSL